MNARVTNLHLVGSGGVRDVICPKALGVEGHGALRAHIHRLCILLSHLEALVSGGVRDVICAKAL